MSGRGQHFIPRFLQAGFNSRPGEKRPRAWLYRKESTKPVETALTNIGKERDFYQATVGDSTLSADEAMTQAESARLSNLVYQLRNGKPGLASDSDCIAELFAHIQLRTKAAWTFTVASMEQFGRLIRVDAEMQHILQEFLGRAAVTHPDLFASVAAQAVPGVDEQHIRRSLPEVLANAPISKIFALSQGDKAGAAYDDMARDVMKVLKVWAMGTMAQRPETVPEFRGCTFVVCDFPETRLVQGDTVVVYHKVDGRFTPILREGEGFDFAFLPLTSSRVLVASKGGVPKSGEALQEASIRCAWSHFISDAKDERLQALASTTGEGIPDITDGDIKEMLRAATKDEHWTNCRAFLGSLAYEAIRKKWVRRPELRGDNKQSEET